MNDAFDIVKTLAAVVGPALAAFFFAQSRVAKAKALKLEKEAEFIESVGGDVGEAIITGSQLIMTLEDAQRALESHDHAKAKEAITKSINSVRPPSRPPGEKQ